MSIIDNSSCHPSVSVTQMKYRSDSIGQSKMDTKVDSSAKLAHKSSRSHSKSFKTFASTLTKCHLKPIRSKQFELKHTGLSTTSLMGIPMHVRPADLKTGRCVENSYRTSPVKIFQPQRVSSIIDKVLFSNLGTSTYQPLHCASSCKVISSDIKSRVKQLNYKRYKILCHVTIGQQTGQSVRVASNAMWDKESDNYATGSFQSKELFAVATVFAIFFE